VADVLGTLAELERRYDGPIPESRRQCLRNSGHHGLLVEARGQAQLFRALVLDQTEAIRRARHNGVIPGRLLADLKLYRQHDFLWRREVRRLEATIKPSAGDAL
jgi:hypothetical protein